MGFARSFRRQMKRRKEMTAKKHRKVMLEPLEPRILLSADLSHTMGDSGEDLSLTLADVEGVETLQLINSNDSNPNTQVVASQALADTSEVRIFGSAENDTLRVDLDFADLPDTLRINFAGGGGDDTLVGPAADSTWHITSNDAGDMGSVDFLEVENLVGGGGTDDMFEFDDGTRISGSIDGGAGGFNTLDYSALQSGVHVDLGQGDATATGGIANIVSVVGTDAVDTLIGDNGDNLLIGGDGNDTLEGGGGTDTLLGGAGDDFLTGGLGVDKIDGGSGTDTLVESRDADFSLTDHVDTDDVTDDAVLTIGPESELLEGVEQADFTAGSADNRFDVSDFSLGSVTLTGGAGADRLDFTYVASDISFAFSSLNDVVVVDSAYDNPITASGITEFSGGSGSDTFDFTAVSANLVFVIRTDGISVSDGGYTVEDDGTVTLTVGSVVLNASQVNHLIGGSGQNTFVFEDGAVLEGTIDGGPGTNNLLDYSALTNSDSNIFVDMLTPDADDTTGSASNTYGISRIQNVIGSAGDDQLYGSAESNILFGGGGDDRFRSGGGADLIDGGEGTDILEETQDADSMVLADMADDDDTPVIENASLTIDSATTKLSSLEEVVLRGGDNTNRLDAENFTICSVILDGGAGDDTLIGGSGDDFLTGGEGVDNLTGGAGIDTVVEERDADFTLTDTTLTIGAEGVDTLSQIEQAKLIGGASANKIDASSFTHGSVTLDGDAGDDVLLGGTKDDFLIGGEGVDNLTGGAGIDTVVEMNDSRFILTDTSLDMAEGVNETVTITLDEGVTGGIFKITFDGEKTADIKFDESDIILKSKLTALDGIDDQDITVVQPVLPLQLDGSTLLAELNLGHGVATVTGDDIQIVLSDGEATVDIDLSSATTVQDVLDLITAPDNRLTAELNADGTGINITDSTDEGSAIEVLALNGSAAAGNLGILGTGSGISLAGEAIYYEMGPWTITFVRNAGGMDKENITVDSTGLTGGVAAVSITQGSYGINTLNGVEKASLLGGLSDNLMDASLFTGDVSMFGLDGDDTLIGGSGADELYGGYGDDQITGNGGEDLIDGGDGFDLLKETTNASSIVLTNTELLMDGVTDILSGIETADLTGGAGGNQIDASGFTGLSADTALDDLNNGNGVRTTDVPSTDLTGLESTTMLYALNGGDGVNTVTGADLRITLRDGTEIDIDLSDAETLQDVIDTLEAAAKAADRSLEVELNSDGNGLVLTDKTAGSADLAVAALNTSSAASDLGILMAGNGGTLEGSPFVNMAGDIRIVLSDGSFVDVDLTFAKTIQDVLDIIDNYHEHLTAELNAARTSIRILDSSGGSGNVNVLALNGSDAASDLGLVGGTASSSEYMGVAIIAGYVTLDGAGGNDELTGTIGNDFFTGGEGDDKFTGGAGIDTIVEERDADFELTDTKLRIGIVEEDTLTQMEQAELTGGVTANILNASVFTLGAVTLATGGGADTLTGGSVDNTFIADVSNLNAVAVTDKVTVAPFSGATNEVIIRGTGETITQKDLEWILWDPAAEETAYTIERKGTLTVGGNLTRAGNDISLAAETINLFGYTIDTSHDTAIAGNIKLEAQHININSGAQLIAKAGTSLNGAFYHGDIQILAFDKKLNSAKLSFENKRLDFRLNYSKDYNEATIAIGSASIDGGSITIEAIADSEKSKAEFSETFIGKTLYSLAGNVLGNLNKVSLVGAVSVATAIADIHIGEDAVINAQNFLAHTIADVDIENTPESSGFGVAVAVGTSNSNIVIDGTITSTGDIGVRSSADHTIKVTSEASKSLSAAVAVSVINSKSVAHITNVANLTAGGNLYVYADTVDRHELSAKSAAGKDGKVGIAVAVGVENGVTQAFLDGSADVSGNIEVKADQKSDDSSTKAEAGVGEDDDEKKDDKKPEEKKKETKEKKENFIDKIKKKAENSEFIKNLTGTIKKQKENYEKFEKAIKLLEDPAIALPNILDIGAAVGVVVDINSSEARIGDGTSLADVQADGSILIEAKTSNRPAIEVSSEVKNSTSSKKESESTAAFGGSVAVAVSVHKDSTNAYISENTQVDCKNEIKVSAQTLNQIDPMSLWGANLVAPFLNKNTHAVHSTDTAGVSTVREGDTVAVTDKHQGKGDTGSWYKYKKVLPLTVELSKVDFTDTDNWENLGNPIKKVGMDFITAAKEYINLNLGYQDNLIDTQTSAKADGQKLALAGAVSIMLFDHDATAVIKDGAKINQDTGFIRNGTSDVVVEAVGVNHTVNVFGNYELPDLTNFWKFNPGTEGADEGSAVGAGVGLYLYDSSLTAKIEDGVSLYADSLEVDADNTTLAVNLGGSGGQSDNLAFNGAFGLNILNNQTLAQIENGAFIEVGNRSVADPDANGASIFVNATDKAYLINVAGAVASSKHVGVGASLGANISIRNTEAVIGNRLGDDSADTRNSFTTTGDIHVSAHNGGFIGAFAVSGSKASNSKAAEESAPPADDGGSGSGGTGGTQGSDGSSQGDADLLAWQKNMADVLKEMKKVEEVVEPVKEITKTSKAKAGVAISGATTVNFLNDDARAYIRNSGPISAEDVTVASVDNTFVASLAGSAAYAKGGDDTKAAVGIAGALGVNVLTGITEAFIDGATSITAESLAIDAIRTGWVVSLVAGVGGAKGRKGVALGGSIAANVSVVETRAGFRNTTGTIGTGSNNGTVGVKAADDANIIQVAGAGGFGGKVGVGASVAFNGIYNSIISKIENVTQLKHTGDMDVNATGDNLIISVTGAIGVGTGGGGEKGYGIGGTLSVNNIVNTIEAGIVGSSTTSDSTGNVSVLAQDSSTVISVSV
jgi:Ca2+-binding RTX toxin-like protein